MFKHIVTALGLFIIGLTCIALILVSAYVSYIFVVAGTISVIIYAIYLVVKASDTS